MMLLSSYAARRPRTTSDQIIWQKSPKVPVESWRRKAGKRQQLPSLHMHSGIAILPNSNQPWHGNTSCDLTSDVLSFFDVRFEEGTKGGMSKTAHRLPWKVGKSPKQSSASCDLHSFFQLSKSNDFPVVPSCLRLHLHVNVYAACPCESHRNFAADMVSALGYGNLENPIETRNCKCARVPCSQESLYSGSNHRNTHRDVHASLHSSAQLQLLTLMSLFMSVLLAQTYAGECPPCSNKSLSTEPGQEHGHSTL